MLNFGHTFGHALEKYTNYSNNLLHGEAISIGMCMASNLSNILGFLSLNNYFKIKNTFIKFELPFDLSFLKRINIKKKEIETDYEEYSVKGILKEITELKKKIEYLEKLLQIKQKSQKQADKLFKK